MIYIYNIIFSLLSFKAYGTEGVYLGEMSLVNHAPVFYTKPYLNSSFHVVGSEDLYYENYFDQLGLKYPQELKAIEKIDINGCNSLNLEELNEQIQLAYRKISLSLIFEELILINEALKLKNDRCFVKENDLFEFEPLGQSMVEWTKKIKNINWAQFNLNYNSAKKYYCQKPEDCSDLKQRCQIQKVNLKTILGEKDRYYGYNQSLVPYFILFKSDYWTKEEKNKNVQSCIKTYRERYQNISWANQQVSSSFLKIQYLLDLIKDDRFNGGRLFYLLTLIRVNPIALEIFKMNKDPLIKLEKDKLSFTHNIEPKVDKTIKPQSPIVTKEDDLPVIKLKERTKGHFYTQAEILKNMRIKKISLDMSLFKYDYIFTLDMIERLKAKLEPFMSLSGLKEMVKHDHLGTVKGPLPLMFLKFLIDQNMHQPLFHIQNMLGTKFYVLNDLESDAEEIVHLIELEFKENWQINILNTIEH